MYIGCVDCLHLVLYSAIYTITVCYFINAISYNSVYVPVVCTTEGLGRLASPVLTIVYQPSVSKQFQKMILFCNHKLKSWTLQLYCPLVPNVVGVHEGVSSTPLPGNMGVHEGVSSTPLLGNMGVHEGVSSTPLLGNMGVHEGVSSTPLPGNIGCTRGSVLYITTGQYGCTRGSVLYTTTGQ